MMRKTFTGPMAVFNIIQKCKYMPDPKKENFEIIEDWNLMPVDDKNKVINFIV